MFCNIITNLREFMSILGNYVIYVFLSLFGPKNPENCSPLLTNICRVVGFPLNASSHTSFGQ